MNLWGSITKYEHCWGVRGKWQGKRVFFSQIPTMTGFLTCKTKEHAKYLQVEISKEIENGVFNPARYKREKPLHLAKYAQKWLAIQESRIPQTLSYKTWEAYRGYIKNHIAPALGDEYLPYITHEKIIEFVNRIKLSIKSKKNIYACLALILKDAERSGYIKKVPPEISFSLPKKRIVWLDDEAFFKVIEEMDLRDRPIFLFTRFTGCRPSEARALRKVNIKKDHIEITHTFAPIPGQGQVLKIVKNKKEDIIPLYDSVKELFASMEQHLSEFVFINWRTGKPYGMNINRDVWNPACQKALGYICPLNNAGRHSFGNILAKAGVDMEVISKLLRHSGTDITKTHYAEPDLNVMKKIVDKAIRIKR